jgi:PleD family two-component response regulator
MSAKSSKKDPADDIAADGSILPAQLSKKELADRIQALCVLVVDDNQYMRKTVRNLLVNCGVKDIYEAGDGITALDTIRTVGPDVVVLDWEMCRSSCSAVMANAGAWSRRCGSVSTSI